MKHVRSRHNPTIKALRALARSAKRVQHGGKHEFLVEGVRETMRVTAPTATRLAPHLHVETLIVSETRWPALLAANDAEALQLAAQLPANVLAVPDDILALLSLRQNPPEVIAHVRGTVTACTDEVLAAANIILVLDALEKPGNVGALIRSATAAGVDAIVLAHEPGARADVFNPHAIRASTGTVFHAPLVVQERTELQAAFARTGHRIVLTTPHTDTAHWSITWPPKCAIVIGSEATGAHDSWFTPEQQPLRIRIPMAENGPDSLNASVAGALVLYEAVRNRLL